MTKCVDAIFDYMHDYEAINCPNCGKFIKWNPEKYEFECKCNGIITIEHDDGWVSVCKKPKLQPSAPSKEA